MFPSVGRPREGVDLAWGFCFVAAFPRDSQSVLKIWSGPVARLRHKYWFLVGLVQLLPLGMMMAYRLVIVILSCGYKVILKLKLGFPQSELMAPYSWGLRTCY